MLWLHCSVITSHDKGIRGDVLPAPASGVGCYCAQLSVLTIRHPMLLAIDDYAVQGRRLHIVWSGLHVQEGTSDQLVVATGMPQPWLSQACGATSPPTSPGKYVSAAFQADAPC